ncbi:hypothetical protein Hamer_G030483, partial [Homarus americanus]
MEGTEEARVKRRHGGDDKEDSLLMKKRSGRVWEDNFTAGEILVLGGEDLKREDDGDDNKWQVKKKRKKRKKNRHKKPTNEVTEEKNGFSKLKSKLRGMKKDEEREEKIFSLSMVEEENILDDQEAISQVRDVTSLSLLLPMEETHRRGGEDPQQVWEVVSVSRSIARESEDNQSATARSSWTLHVADGSRQHSGGGGVMEFESCADYADALEKILGHSYSCDLDLGSYGLDLHNCGLDHSNCGLDFGCKASQNTTSELVSSLLSYKSPIPSGLPPFTYPWGSEGRRKEGRKERRTGRLEKAGIGERLEEKGTV